MADRPRRSIGPFESACLGAAPTISGVKAARLRESTRGRKHTDSAELIREDRNCHADVTE